MMNIYLLRHAKAEEITPENPKPDAERVLTPEGTRRMRQVAEGMRALKLTFDVILSSPYPRARQTAEIAARALGLEDRLVLTPQLTFEADPTDIVAELRANHATHQSVLLVGHEPFLGNLASLLLSGGSLLTVDFKKAGLMALSVEQLRSGRCAVLDWFLTPRQLAALG